MKRNYNIDFLRGLAVISVALIHTAWHSGVSYVPDIFRNLTLLIDVPLFIFISGMTFSFHKSVSKNISGIVNLWKNWLFFLIFYCAILYFFDRANINLVNILSWIAFTFNSDNILHSVGWSIWFVQMFIKVSIFSGIIIYFTKKYEEKEERKMLISVSAVFLLLFLYIQQGNYFLIFDREILAYSIIYILGYLSMKYKINSIKKLLIIETFIIGFAALLFKGYGHTLVDLQNLKAPIHMIYLTVSFIGITFMVYLRDKINIGSKNLIANIGKNALFFYFAQGVSSSILFKILPYINISTWYLKFIVMFMINILMAFIFANILKYSYSFVSSIFNKIKVGKSSKIDHEKKETE